MIITGNGPYLEKCKQIFLVDTMFTGLKNSKDLTKIYAPCNIFVCRSATEIFGNVILEAIAFGLPEIGVDDGGVGETIQN